MTSTNKTAEKATTTAAATEATAWDAAQAAAPEMATLEAMVAKLERDLAATGVDLSSANRQFSEVTNRLQVVSEEAT
jgi:hypothetical protein